MIPNSQSVHSVGVSLDQTLTYIHTERERDRERQRQTDRQIDRQTGRQRERERALGYSLPQDSGETFDSKRTERRASLYMGFGLSVTQ